MGAAWQPLMKGRRNLREPTSSPILANASKIHEGKEMAEATRLLIDITGGFVADLPSDKDFNNPEIGDL